MNRDGTELHEAGQTKPFAGHSHQTSILEYADKHAELGRSSVERARIRGLRQLEHRVRMLGGKHSNKPIVPRCDGTCRIEHHLPDGAMSRGYRRARPCPVEIRA